VRHRRQTHRFPVRIEAAYGVGDGIPLQPATAHDLNPFGLAMRVRGRIPQGCPLRVVLLLETGPLEVVGTVARAEQESTDAFDVGVRFEALPQNKQDAIMRWCFAQPFGPDAPVQGDGSRPGDAAERAATKPRRAPFRARGPSRRAPDAVPATSDP
jgi:hypothetical protein